MQFSGRFLALVYLLLESPYYSRNTFILLLISFKTSNYLIRESGVPKKGDEEHKNGFSIETAERVCVVLVWLYTLDLVLVKILLKNESLVFR